MKGKVFWGMLCRNNERTDYEHFRASPGSGQSHPYSDSTPRGIIKLHYYKIKETIMSIAWEKEAPSLLDHLLQLFVNITPSTIQKRRTMKPLSQLTKKNLKYQWAVPFHIIFLYETDWIIFLCSRRERRFFRTWVSFSKTFKAQNRHLKATIAFCLCGCDSGTFHKEYHLSIPERRWQRRP